MLCYDWATEQRKAGNCVMSGFHSTIEKDVLHFLLKGKQPIILVLARSIYKQLPEEFIKPLAENRLLIVSVVPQSIFRQSIETAIIRNKFIIDNSDELVFGSLDNQGSLFPLYETIKNHKKVTVL